MDDISELTHYLHRWAKGSSINLVNILPRESRVRNDVINILNEFIFRLSCQSCKFINIINTERNINLFSNY